MTPWPWLAPIAILGLTLTIGILALPRAGAEGLMQSPGEDWHHIQLPLLLSGGTLGPGPTAGPPRQTPAATPTRTITATATSPVSVTLTVPAPTAPPTATLPTAEPTEPGPTTTSTPTPEPTAGPSPTTAPAIRSWLRNGGFELGPNGDWTETSGPLTQAGQLIFRGSDLNPYRPHSGSFAAWLGRHGDGHSMLSQTIVVGTIDPVLHYWIKAESVRMCGNLAFTISVAGQLQHEAEVCNQTDFDWTAASLDLSEFAGQEVELAFALNHLPGSISHVLLDDLEFRSPEPLTDRR